MCSPVSHPEKHEQLMFERFAKAVKDDGDGQITIAEFCRGLMQLKGQARALDIVMLARENGKILRECQEIRKAVDPLERTL